MEKEFSFTEMFRYCFRKWLVILIAAIIGCGGFSVYSFVIKDKVDIVSYKGNATIASINTLYPEINNEIDKEVYSNIILSYNQNLSRALNIMSTNGLKNKVYHMVKDLYEPDKIKQNNGASERDFMAALKVEKTAISVEVSFVSRESSEKELELCRKIVDKYLDEAMGAAQLDNPILKGENAIVKGALIQSSDIILPDGTVINGTSDNWWLLDVLIGLFSGVVVGFIVTIVLYFCDHHIKSFGDIAFVAGNKLFGVCKNENMLVCPKIDASVNAKNIKTVLFASCGSTQIALGDEYSKYCAAAGYRTLIIDFNGKNTNGRGFVDSMNNGVINAEDNAVSVINARAGEWITALKNKKQFDAVSAKFDRVIIVCDYLHDGAIAVLGQICECCVLVVDQTSCVKKDVYSFAEEFGNMEKMLGSAIYNAKNNYVGAIN